MRPYVTCLFLALASIGCASAVEPASDVDDQLPVDPSPSDSEIIESDVAAVLELLDAIETCTTEEVSASVPLENVDATVGAWALVNGQLDLGWWGACTLAVCPGRACCNGCLSGITIATADEALSHLLIDPTGGTELGVHALDCSLSAIHEILRRTHVVVGGTFEERSYEPGRLLIAVERLCRIE